MSPRPEITLIAALADNGVIGRDNDLPWRIPADLKRFKARTQGRPLIMGRRNYESIGRPLPGRHNIVLTRRRDWQAEGCTVVHDPEAALAAAGDVEEVMVIGGEEIYRLFLPRADRLELTRVHTEVPGDTFFPDIDPADWQVVAEQQPPSEETNDWPLTYQTLERRR
ncbi:type 3 dihydrofolate reductase [Alkalilimnicola ehrlichii MLHE-1]|uniref:Dihydrofolate reductase n=1 Tax=Alkalilimnicola ehrlichii (strain ATCC BAA-1101 / DSM 17681 / MLHE-1) TaxID=187272 RepID=Q0ABL0_ALKEH|nr:type 3 dihydrofolate reductase [Alkalilimnicola ehrlichii]ABI55777.1 dihydrofolate reductase [Alkalilimnicola ehrlichii MLHE-1]